MFNYLDNGANAQARAVLAYLSQPDGIEASWDDNYKRYVAEPRVSRWENCREQGYVVYMRSRHGGHQINIAFFEHRNSDNICAVKWEQCTINAPTIDTAEFKDIYKDKYDVSYTVGYGECLKMADWIEQQLISFWHLHKAEKEG